MVCLFLASYLGPTTSFIIPNSLKSKAETKMTQLVLFDSFEAQVDPEALKGLLVTSSVLVGAASVWWYQIVPAKRLEVSKSKRQGEIKEMLDEIKGSEDNEMLVKKWLFADWLRPGPKKAALPMLKKAKWNSGDNPILVAFSAVISCVIASSIAERSAHFF